MSEANSDRFKIVVAILIALVSIVGAVGGGRAGFLNTEDGELTRTGLLNKTRQQQIELQNRLIALDQSLYAEQYTEQMKLAELTGANAVEARQQGRSSEARALEEQADAFRRMANHLHSFFYADYITPSGGYDQAQLEDELKLSLSAREYRGLQPEGYITRGDARGEIGIRSMLGLAVATLSLLFFGLADMMNRKLKYVMVALGVAVLLFSIWMLINA